MEDNIKCDLRKTGLGCEFDPPGSGHGTAASSCEHGKELSESIKDVELLEKLSVLLSLSRTLIHGVI
jgi:hypothetical protein